jgi:hypothetical protein
MLASASFRSAGALHAELRAALVAVQRAEKQAVLCFAEILERILYRELEYSSIHAYAAEALGFSQSKSYQFIRLAESLETLPVLKRSLEQGEVSWTKAREVARIATPKTQERWVAEARSSTRRQLVEKVDLARDRRQAARRACPDQQALALVPQLEAESGRLKPSEARCKATAQALPPAEFTDSPSQIVFRLDALQLACYEALMETLRKSSHRGSREALLLVALTELAAAGAAPSKAAADAASSADCTRVQSAPPYQIIVRKCEVCQRSEVLARGNQRPLGRAVAEAVACDARVLVPGKRNQAEIPPARRRAALARDGYRCQAPGCRSSHYLEVHHRRPRAQGGGDELGNLVTLCSACHQLAHERGLADRAGAAQGRGWLDASDSG